MDFWSPSTKAQQAVKVRVSLQPEPDPADTRVQSVKKKTKKNQNQTTPKKQAQHFFQRPDGRCRQGIQP